MRSTRQIQLTASRRLMSCLHRVNLRRFRLRKAKRVVVRVPKTSGTFVKLNLLAKDKTSLHWGHSLVLGWFPVLNHFSNAHRSACICGPSFTFLGKSPLTASTTPAFLTTSLGLPATTFYSVESIQEDCLCIFGRSDLDPSPIRKKKYDRPFFPESSLRLSVEQSIYDFLCGDLFNAEHRAELAQLG